MGDDYPRMRQYPIGSFSFEWVAWLGVAQRSMAGNFLIRSSAAKRTEVESNAGACVVAFCRHWKAETPAAWQCSEPAAILLAALPRSLETKVMAIFNFGSQYHHGYTIGVLLHYCACPLYFASTPFG